ncbi:DsbA family oxidoreductase [Microterricola viridarii]|uniref:Predicted dithiol-disulfide isomerase, DsbA family n=1 Tax=Microterricola viridarii TaxID=412690 RepID=A0A1H1VNV9_9MICO|nr:DsbA family oxidoreductase [Microterricola viridarii]SDS86170.1 Predicted dithiol-disulfide isomerase, DsbA family [Microterricola viridarii]
MTEPIKIDVWSDIACPWCFIGKRKFEGGVAAFQADADAPEVIVEYHSYELSPDTPVDFEGSEIDFLAEHKGMPAEQLRGMLEQVTGVAAAVGLEYNFDILKHTNTVKAHQLLHYAKAQGIQLQAAERLFSAYFTEGRHLGRAEDLADLGAELGLDRADVLRSLNEDEYLPAVRADQAQAQQFGINGVPFFVIDGKYGVSGAQDPDTFAQVLQQVRSERAEEIPA